jgi:hypothetical protein
MLSTRNKVNNECLHIENDEHVQTIVGMFLAIENKQVFKCLHVKNHDIFWLIVDNKNLLLSEKKSMNICTLKIINILN